MGDLHTLLGGLYHGLGNTSGNAREMDSKTDFRRTGDLERSVDFYTLHSLEVSEEIGGVTTRCLTCVTSYQRAPYSGLSYIARSQ